MSAKELVFEAQTPINERCQTKALRPPVSLKNYFSVKPKNVDTDDIDKQSLSDIAHMESPSFYDGRQNTLKSASKLKPVQMKLVDSLPALPSATNPETPIIIDDGESHSSQVEKQVSRKRKSVEPGITSLTKLFKQANRPHVTTCPVCGLKIEDVSNSGINLHIDKCLKRSSQ